MPEINDPKLIKEWLQVQKDELEIQQQELQRSAQESTYSYEYSKLALETDERIFNQHCRNQQSTINKTYWFGGIIIFMILSFMGYLVYSGNSDLVFEILKGLGYVGAGGAGGYGLGYKKASQKTTPKE